MRKNVLTITKKRDSINLKVTKNRNRKEENMRNLSILIDEDLHKEVKITAASKGKTVKQYLINLIKKDLETKKEQTH